MAFVRTLLCRFMPLMLVACILRGDAMLLKAPVIVNGSLTISAQTLDVPDNQQSYTVLRDADRQAANFNSNKVRFKATQVLSQVSTGTIVAV